ncbi:hypothetical protein TrST_g4172 [Triparma strigata]|uniref:TLC domain-containing protein n=1 Tax=Triparma strigata TaxID=1606541 RepID=A0A9W7AEU4_9STRA|nr:hypothetical protein TrST_g4172 [Triparma strigata]
MTNLTKPGVLLSYVLSTIHSVAQTAFALYSLPRFLSVPPLERLRCYYQCDCDLAMGVYIMSSVLIVYFMVDLILMHKTSTLTPSFVFHHIMFGSTAVVQLMYQRSCFPYAWLSLGELSTLFLNARWYYKYHKRNTESPVFQFVQVGFAVTFFFTRIVIYGLGLHHFFYNDENVFKGYELWQTTPVLFLAGYLLNVFWFSKIVSQVPRPSRPSNLTTFALVILAFYSWSSNSPQPYSTLTSTTATTATTTTMTDRSLTLVNIWEQHTACEFDPNIKSVECTMDTMTSDPIVNHVPTMIGGVGYEEVENFYRQNFIFTNPDMNIDLVSRTVGTDSLVDEMVIEFEHVSVVDWLAPSVEPSFKTIRFPLVAIVAFAGDKISSEHLYFDQAGVLLQMGVIDASVGDVTGAEQAELKPTNKFLKRAGRVKYDEL